MSDKKKAAKKAEKAERKARDKSLHEYLMTVELDDSPLPPVPPAKAPDKPDLHAKIVAINEETKRKAHSARSRLGGYATAGKMTAEERSERARKGGIALAAKRAAEREALGIKSNPGKRRERFEPSYEDLSDFLEEFDRAHPSETFTYEARRRGAMILMRSRLAELEYRGYERR